MCSWTRPISRFGGVEIYQVGQRSSPRRGWKVSSKLQMLCLACERFSPIRREDNGRALPMPVLLSAFCRVAIRISLRISFCLGKSPMETFLNTIFNDTMSLLLTPRAPRPHFRFLPLLCLILCSTITLSLVLSLLFALVSFRLVRCYLMR